jgi:HAMP domain-containing protein
MNTTKERKRDSNRNNNQHGIGFRRVLVADILGAAIVGLCAFTRPGAIHHGGLHRGIIHSRLCSAGVFSEVGGMTPQEEIQSLKAALQNMRNELKKAMTTNHNVREQKKDAQADCITMRESMAEIREYLNQGRIRDALDVINNEESAWMARREKRKNKA